MSDFSVSCPVQGGLFEVVEEDQSDKHIAFETEFILIDELMPATPAPRMLQFFNVDDVVEFNFEFVVQVSAKLNGKDDSWVCVLSSSITVQTLTFMLPINVHVLDKTTTKRIQNGVKKGLRFLWNVAKSMPI